MLYYFCGKWKNREDIKKGCNPICCLCCNKLANCFKKWKAGKKYALKNHVLWDKMPEFCFCEIKHEGRWCSKVFDIIEAEGLPREKFVFR